MALHWIWAILGALLMSAELLLPGVYLLWIGLAALLAAPVVWLFEPGLIAQLLVFAALCVALVAFGWRLGGRHGAAAPGNPNAAADNLVGEAGTIAAPGRVAVRDGVWTAEPASLPVGTAVRVVGHHGLTLQVAPLEPALAARQPASPYG